MLQVYFPPLLSKYLKGGDVSVHTQCACMDCHTRAMDVAHLSLRFTYARMLQYISHVSFHCNAVIPQCVCPLTHMITTVSHVKNVALKYSPLGLE